MAKVLSIKEMKERAQNKANVYNKPFYLWTPAKGARTFKITSTEPKPEQVFLTTGVLKFEPQPF